MGDVSDDLAGLGAALDADGPPYEVVGDAAGALSHLDGSVDPPDCVVAQQALPDRDGLSLLRRVRRDRPGTATVLLVDWAFADELNRATASGVDAVLCHATEEPSLVAGTVRELLVDREAAARADRLAALRAGAVELARRLAGPSTRREVEAAAPAVLREVGPYDVAWTSVADGDGVLVPTAAAGVPREALRERPVGEVPTAGVEVETADDGVVVVVSLDRDGERLGTVHLVAPEPPTPAERATLAAVGEVVAAAIDAARGHGREVGVGRVLAHELRNHTQVGRLHLSAARENGSEDRLAEVAEVFARIERLAEEAEALTREEFADAERERVALREVAATAWDGVGADDARLDLTGEPTVDGNEAAVTLALENLFRNSVHHGGDGVTVRVGPLPDGFYVEDTGEGLPAADPERLFDPEFSTADGRSGLGLAIVGQVADAHGWEVRATEGSAGGARFEVYTGSG